MRGEARARAHWTLNLLTPLICATAASLAMPGPASALWDEEPSAAFENDQGPLGDIAVDRIGLFDVYFIGNGGLRTREPGELVFGYPAFEMAEHAGSLGALAVDGERDDLYQTLSFRSCQGDFCIGKSVAEYDGSGGGAQFVRKWQVDRIPADIAVSPRDRRVYVLLSNERIEVFEPDGGATGIGWSVPDAEEIAVAPSGDVYTAGTRVRAFSFDGQPKDSFASQQQSVGDFEVGPFGRLVVADRAADEVVKYFGLGSVAEGSVVERLDTGVLGPQGIAIGPNGDLHATVGNTYRIYALTSTVEPFGSPDDGGTVVEAVNTGLVAAPPRFTNRRTFTFRPITSGVRLGCQLRRRGQRTGEEEGLAKWRPCDERKTYRRLREGRYVFLGRSFDSEGNQDPVPLRVPFTVDRDRPQTRIKGGPRGATRGRAATFKLRSSEKRSRIECRLIRRARRANGKDELAHWHPCERRSRFRGLRRGSYVIKARAIDLAGNRDRSPAARRFAVGR